MVQLTVWLKKEKMTDTKWGRITHVEWCSREVRRINGILGCESAKVVFDGVGGCGVDITEGKKLRGEKNDI